MVTSCFPPRLARLFFILMSLTLMAFCFPQHHLQPLQSDLPTIGQEESKAGQWGVLYPSISLRDWSIQMLTAPGFGGAKARPEQVEGDDWLPLSQSQMEEELRKDWSADWPSHVGHQQKRNIVVADDAAFREKSKLLTAMERQKWLNSYMQKLLVVNSK